MANTETEKTVQVESETEQETKKQPQKPVEEKRVTIKLPLTKTERDDVVVGLNGVNYQIKRGVPVEVPEGVAEILEHQEEMLAASMEFEAQAAAALEELDKR